MTVEHSGSCLEHPVRPLLRPLHLLELGEALAHDLIHHRFHKPRRDRLRVSPELAVVGDEPLIGFQVRVELIQGFA